MTVWRVLVPIVKIAGVCAAAVFVVMPLALGYWYISTGHKSFRIPDLYFLYALAAVVVTILLPIYYVWWQDGSDVRNGDGQ